jgi:hypothetical protein
MILYPLLSRYLRPNQKVIILINSNIVNENQSLIYLRICSFIEIKVALLSEVHQILRQQIIIIGIFWRNSRIQ